MTYAEKAETRINEENDSTDWWGQCIEGEGYNCRVTDFVDHERGQIAFYNDGSYLEDIGPRFEAKQAVQGQDVPRDSIRMANWNGKEWKPWSEFYTTFRLVDGEHELVRITAHVIIDPYDGDPDIKWLHPMTGSECQELSQIFYGWSEQNPEEDTQWAELAHDIRNDDTLIEKLATNEGESYIDYQHDQDW